MSLLLFTSYDFRKTPDHISKKQIEATIVISVIDTSYTPISAGGMRYEYTGKSKKVKILDENVPKKKQGGISDKFYKRTRTAQYFFHVFL